MPDAPTISACLIVKDEASVLERCLSSLEGAADEIVVVDTGSTDNTKEIASKYTEKVYHFEWCDDFSAARNFANSKATGDWILTMDADEYIPEGNQPLFKEAVRVIQETDYLMIMPRVYMIAEGEKGKNGERDKGGEPPGRRRCEEGAGEEAKRRRGEGGEAVQGTAGQQVNGSIGQRGEPPRRRRYEEGVEQVFFGQRLLRRGCGIEWENPSHNVLRAPPERCLRAAPLKIHHDRGARHNLRNLQRARQRQRMNLANLRAAVKANPSDKRSWFYLGNTYLDGGHHASAVRSR